MLNSPPTQHHIFFRNSPLYSKINPVALRVGVGDINGRPAYPLEGVLAFIPPCGVPESEEPLLAEPSNSCYGEEIVLKNVSHRITRLDHEEEHSCRLNGTSCRFSLACLLHRGFFLINGIIAGHSHQEADHKGTVKNHRKYAIVEERNQ